MARIINVLLRGGVAIGLQAEFICSHCKLFCHKQRSTKAEGEGEYSGSRPMDKLCLIPQVLHSPMFVFFLYFFKMYILMVSYLTF